LWSNAYPIVGVWDVPMPPTTLAMAKLRAVTAPHETSLL